MKKTLFILMILGALFCASAALAADIKVSELTARTTLTADDLMLVTWYDSGNYYSRKMTIQNFFTTIPTSISTSASNGNNRLSMTNNTSEPSCTGGNIHSLYWYGASDAASILKVCENGTAKIPLYRISPTKTTVGTSRSMDEAAEYVFCSNTCTVTPPTPVAGYQLCVMNAPGSATVITLANISSVYYGKTDNSGWQANANYKLVSGGAATDKICIVGYDTTHYIVMSSTGIWTHTAP